MKFPTALVLSAVAFTAVLATPARKFSRSNNANRVFWSFFPLITSSISTAQAGLAIQPMMNHRLVARATLVERANFIDTVKAKFIAVGKEIDTFTTKIASHFTSNTLSAAESQQAYDDEQHLARLQAEQAALTQAGEEDLDWGIEEVGESSSRSSLS